MSFLSDYLARRREIAEGQVARQEDEQSSPEELLEALSINTGNTADLIGKQSAETKTQNKAVLGGLENIASAIASSKPAPSEIEVSIERASDIEQRTTTVTNKALADIAHSLKELVKTNKLVEKYLRPDLNPTDDTYQKSKLAALAVGKDKKVDPKSSSGGLGGLLASGLIDLFNPKPTGTPTGKPAPAGGTPKVGRTTVRGGVARTVGHIDAKVKTIPTEPVQGRVGKFLSGTRKVLGDVGTRAAETATRLAPKMQTFAAKAWDATKGAATKAGTVATEVVERNAPKVTEALSKAKGAIQPTVTKAGEVLSKGASKSVEYVSRAKEALTPVAEKALESTKSAATTVAEKGSKALSWVKQTGTDLIGKAKNLGGATEAAPKVMGATAGSASGVAEGSGKGFASGAKSVLGSAGRLVGRLATPIAVGLSAKETYDTEQDTTTTRDQKNVKHGATGGGLAGGLAGATAGASMGAALGTVVPGIGNVVGGLAGGVIGGIGGYFGGSLLGEKGVEGYQAVRGPEKDPLLVGATEQKKIDSTTAAMAATLGTKAVTEKAPAVVGGAQNLTVSDGVKTALGASIAMAIAPISKDAQETVSDTLVPALNDTGKRMSDGAESISKSNETLASSFSSTLSDWSDSFTDILGGVKNAASSAWAGAKQAASSTVAAVSDTASAVKKGYKEGGVMGAVGKGTKAAQKGAASVYDETLGAVSAKFESGGRGVGTVSSGKGDKGGVSYGKHQLATNNGSMDKFLSSKEGSDVSKGLAGLKPGSPEFNAKYKEITSGDGGKAMEAAQQAYMQRTHFDPQAAKLQQDLGMDVSKEGRAVKEAVFSTATQYGPDSSIITKALNGKDLSTMSDAAKVAAIQKYKADNVDANFKSSSPEVRDSVAKRIESEGQVLAQISQAPASTATTGGLALDAVTTSTASIKPTFAPIAKAKEATPVTPVTQVASLNRSSAPAANESSNEDKAKAATSERTAQTSAERIEDIAVSAGVAQQTFQDTEASRNNTASIRMSEVAPTVVASSNARTYGNSPPSKAPTGFSVPDIGRLTKSSKASDVLSLPEMQPAMKAVEIARAATSGNVGTMLASLTSETRQQSAPSPAKVYGSAQNFPSFNPVSDTEFEPFESNGGYKKVASISSGKPDFEQAPKATVNRVVREPMQRVASNVPAESAPVTVSNPAPTVSTSGSNPAPAPMSNAFDTAVPKLENVPLQIADLGLVLLNIGHI